MDADSEKSGIFVTRGVSIRLSNLRFVVDPSGEVSMPPVTVDVLLNTSPFWLEIAMAHLVAAETHHAALLAAGRDQEKISTALEGEFVEGMQTIVAAATSLDAFYATVKANTELPADLTQIWRRNRTPRYAQITEVLRRAFSLKPHTAKNWRPMLRDLYRFRGWAVHPSAAFSAPVGHPDLPTFTERRFVAFGYENARRALRVPLAIITLLTAKRRDGASEGLTTACEGIAKLIQPVSKEWRMRYGALTDDAALESSG